MELVSDVHSWLNLRGRDLLRSNDRILPECDLVHVIGLKNGSVVQAIRNAMKSEGFDERH
jgi:hypothetical protein